MPSCVSTYHNYAWNKGYWYEVENDCAESVTVLVSILMSWDEHFVLGTGERRYKDWRQGSVSGFYCCTDDPSSHCDAKQDLTKNRDQRPRYYFQVRIKAVMHAPDYPHEWTARLACHSHDRNRWIDETIEPSARVWCDARYGAHVWITFEATNTTSKVHIEAPYRNPCAIGGPVYRITQGADEGLTFSTHIEYEQYGCA